MFSLTRNTFGKRFLRKAVQLEAAATEGLLYFPDDSLGYARCKLALATAELYRSIAQALIK